MWSYFHDPFAAESKIKQKLETNYIKATNECNVEVTVYCFKSSIRSSI